ncbi:hypothetical protein ACJX0J_016255, partial [Zea mays]
MISCLIAAQRTLFFNTLAKDTWRLLLKRGTSTEQHNLFFLMWRGISRYEYIQVYKEQLPQFLDMNIIGFIATTSLTNTFMFLLRAIFMRTLGIFLNSSCCEEGRWVYHVTFLRKTVAISYTSNNHMLCLHVIFILSMYSAST